MTDDSNHYSDLHEVYGKMIDRHRKLRASANKEDDPELEAARDEAIQHVALVEELLNEWADRDDRDGPE